ncbi:MAG TPA: hypothetical protein DIS96_03330 [Pusillimonas sp.]|nr:hypothetical protein [Pusillimonas sp.]|tara:strand:- start:34403 stop:35542 length:1140 start_codon:yes stop_codon:yes gene_type:complete
MTNIDIGNFDATLQNLEEAHHAPGFIYHDPQVFKREKERIFMKDWLYVGREEEVPNPGDFMTLRLVGEPVMLVRDKDGTLRALLNMCLHRGVEVAEETSGNTRAFRCPYHGWTYDLSGKLTGAQSMKELPDFDISSKNLRPIKLETWHGNVFICFDANPPPFKAFIQDIEENFSFLRMDKCQLGFKLKISFACNWKFAFENLMDFYHVPVLHAKSFGSRVRWGNDGVELNKLGGSTINYSTSPSTPGGLPLMGKMPWLEQEDVSLGRAGYLQPSLSMFARIDYAGPMVIWPVDETHCEVWIYRLFPEEVFQRPDIDEKLKVYHDFQITVLEEDRTMIESMQRAMQSKNYVPGHMAPLEKTVHHYLKNYIHRVFGPEDAS